MSAGLPRVVVLGSGVGSNFAALARYADQRYEIVAVGSDQAESPILERASQHGIPAFSLSRSSYRDQAAHDAALAATIKHHRPDWIALAGYMRLLGPETLGALPGRIINVHPALLPAFPGLDTHRRALAAGVREHGCTVHFVIAEVDAGASILQARLPVTSADSTRTLEARVKTMEHRIYPQALAWCAAGRIALREGSAWLDGKRLAAPVTVNEADS